jgi:hypothetical protein
MRLCCGLLVLLVLPWTLVASDPPSAPSNDKEWSDKLVEIAKNYKNYERADRFFRFAPIDCRAPTAQVPQLRLSQSSDPATHGRKLYTVFANNLHWDSAGRTKTYLPPFPLKYSGAKREPPRQPAPVGQVVVKEAWSFTEIDDQEYQKITSEQKNAADSAKDKNGWTTFDHGKDLLPVAYNSARQNEKPKYYKGTSIAGLFIMTKFKPRTPDTDAGWIYGTVDADLKTVTSVGKVANCMKCHQDAPHDRLFGLPY